MGNGQEHTALALLRQAVDRHPAGCTTLNHTERLRIETAVRHFVGGAGHRSCPLDRDSDPPVPRKALNHQWLLGILGILVVSVRLLTTPVKRKNKKNELLAAAVRLVADGGPEVADAAWRLLRP